MPFPVRPPEELFDMISYDPITGDCHWTRTPRGGTSAGDKAGGLTNDGYVRIRFKNKKYPVQNIAWFLISGDWPSDYFVDHINGDPGDNRACNLRPATKSQNIANTRKRKGPATSKYKGVCYVKSADRWRAQITKDGVLRGLGSYVTEDEAAAAYASAAIELFGEYARAQ